MNKAIRETNLPDLKLLWRGKVRDVYDLDKYLLIVTTDRISAFDSVFPEAVPDKGKVLNQLSNFWFHETEHIIKNHIVAADVSDFPEKVKKYSDILRGRSIVVRKAVPMPVECVVRGYLDGSAWAEYKKMGQICGIQLPDGLSQKSELSDPIFTPATKAETGHDENISMEQVTGIVGEETAEFLKEKSIAIYDFARKYISDKEIVIVDTKFEFGKIGEELLLIDEILTPDSSRFFEKDTYYPDRESKSFDKQFVRDYVVSIGWDKEPPAPHLPEDIIQKTAEKYRTIYKIITGKDLEE